jgi:capsular polysaccharide export protein
MSARSFFSSRAAGRWAARNRPILRAPPFPGARPRGGPVALVAERSGALGPLVSDDIVQAIAKARVGASFWRPASHGDFSCLLRAESLAAARAFLAAQPIERARGILSWVSTPHPAWRRGSLAGVDAVFGDIDAWSLIERAERIVAFPDDEVALLAGAAGKPVYHPVSGERLDQADLRASLLRALEAFDYADPYTGQRIELPEWIEILGFWRATIDANRQVGAVAGVTGWKRGVVRQFLWSGEKVTITRSSRPPRLPDGKAIALWPSRAPRELAQRCERQGVPVIRMEDGFIRSIGLGVQLHLPSSIALDRIGIYYDPTGPSDLERILSDAAFDPCLIERAHALARRAVAGGVTKYSSGVGDTPQLPPAGRRVLVPGQVEDDLSVELGSAGVRGNLDLLRRVRQAEPDAWIAYRPHPDVAAGLRRGHVGEDEALRYADAVLHDGSIAGLLGQVDCVHVLTSLAGFEALLRGCEVVTHGQPFYAGWGLTKDLAPRLARRQRRLTLPELVAGALILYPRYLDPVTRLPCPPEVLVDRHVLSPDVRPTLLNNVRVLQGRARLAGRRLGGAAA